LLVSAPLLVNESPTAASLAVRSPSASCRCRAATHPGGNQPPGTCLLSVSHALEALLRPTPAGLVSCRSRPWGFALQGRFPPAEQGFPFGGPCPPAVRLPPGPSTPAPERSAHLEQVPVTSRNLRGEALRETGSTPGLRSLQASASSIGLFKPDSGPRPSWASSSLGGSLSPPAILQGSILS
jgi:hypothetical protein